MNGKTWLLFATTDFILCLTPGPAVLFIVSQGMRRGFRASLAGTAGILSGNAIYFALSAVGLGAVLIASSGVFQAIKWIGAAYLIVAGVKMLLAAIKSYRADERSDSTPLGGDIQPETSGRPLKLLAQGLVTQLSNPKAVVFFSALLPQFISPGDVPFQFLILGITSLSAEFVVLVSYGWIAERGSRLIQRGRIAAIRDGAAGAFLMAAGAGLAGIRRP